jgi:uncharacterized glyoxalase superfamily protein PhnB
MKVPEGYQTVMPYLILKDASGFLNFSQKLFKAIELQKVTDDNGEIIHAEIKIGDSTIMFGQSGGQWMPAASRVVYSCEDSDETYKKALELGAKSIMEPSDQTYGRNSGIADPFGNTWWLVSQKLNSQGVEDGK